MGSLKILRSIQVSWDQKDSFIVTNILYLKLPVLCFRNSGIWGKKIFISMNLKNFLRIQKKKRNSEFSVRSIFTKKLNFSIEIVFIKGPELNNKRIKILWPFNQQKIQKDKNTDLKRKKPWSQPVFVFQNYTDKNTSNSYELSHLNPLHMKFFLFLLSKLPPRLFPRLNTSFDRLSSSFWITKPSNPV